MRFIIPALRSVRYVSALVAFAFTVAPASAWWQGVERDLRGIWMAQNGANANLESANVIVDPSDRKIPYQPGALSKRKQNSANRATADPETRCFQPGVPRANYLPTPFQIFQNDRGMYMVYQDVHAYRIIYMNGSPHNEGLPYAMGDSRGRWEGNTLVVDATSFSDATWLDRAGNYHSDALHVVERYTRTNHDTLVYEATIEDPKVFTRPWKIRMPLRLQTGPGIQILEDECEEDESGVRRHVSPFKAK